MAASPTSRTLEALRSQGWSAGVVEKWNGFSGPINPRTGKPSGLRVDLFGFIDVVAIRGDRQGVLAIQATTNANINARLEKIQGIPEAREWLLAGNRIEVWGWKKKTTWEAIARVVTLDDFA